MDKDMIGNGLKRGIVLFVLFLIILLFIQPVRAQHEQLVLLMPTPSKYLDPCIGKFKDWYFEQTGKTIEVEHVRMDGVECAGHVEKQEKHPYEDVVASIGYEELDRLKSMFIASMSHELRTPLNSIIGFTGIILQGITGELNEEQRKQLIMVKNSASHLLALINDVIDVSKIEAGKVDLLIEEFDLSALAQEVESFLSSPLPRMLWLGTRRKL